MDKINRPNYSKTSRSPVRFAVKVAGVALLCLVFFLAGYYLTSLLAS